MTQLTFGMCSSAGIDIWPTRQSISRNPIFVIQGYSLSQKLIKNLNINNAIYLTSDTERVNLNIIKIIQGQFNVMEAILKPEKELTAYKTYELHIDSLEEFDKNEFHVTKWTVADSVDNKSPEWVSKPKFKNKTYSSYGCGTGEHVNFCACITDQSPTLIHIKFTNKKNNHIYEYYLPFENNIIKIGHGMCSGAFSFDQQTDYQVSFSLMDASGNISKTTTKPIKFTPPTKDDIPEESKISCECNNRNGIWKYSLLVSGILIAGFYIYIWKTKTHTQTLN